MHRFKMPNFMDAPNKHMQTSYQFNAGFSSALSNFSCTQKHSADDEKTGRI
jgi:hypothetical protein